MLTKAQSPAAEAHQNGLPLTPGAAAPLTLTCAARPGADVAAGGLDVLVVGHVQLQNVQPSRGSFSQLLSSSPVDVQHAGKHQRAHLAELPRQLVSEPGIATSVQMELWSPTCSSTCSS